MGTGQRAGGLHILLTLRVDFIPRCGELFVDAQGLRLDRVAGDERHRIFVSLPEPAQLRAAIVEPARQVGLSLQAGLADRIPGRGWSRARRTAAPARRADRAVAGDETATS